MKRVLILLALTSALLSSCVFPYSNSGGRGTYSEGTLTYEGREYTLSDSMSLDFSDFTDYREGLLTYCEKIGAVRNAEIYQIKGYDWEEWLYVDNISMLYSDSLPNGVYERSDKGQESP